MYKLVIEGGRRLHGRVAISGAKNAVLPILAASLLTDQECVIRNVARLRDVAAMVSILRTLGAEVSPEADGNGDQILRVRAARLRTDEVPDALVRRMRSSIFLMGPLLGRLGRVRLSYPGGCAIGPRPINFHLKALARMGAEITERNGYLVAEAGALTGAHIHLDQPSVGATENVMMAAVLARGTTVLSNAAREPEIADLQGFLNAMGARVSGAGTDTVTIEGVTSLHGADYRVIPDRIEAGTFMVAAAITRGDLTLSGADAGHMESTIAKLREAGARVDVNGSEIRVQGPDRPRPVDIRTAPYPGFPTDLQSQFMALLSVADGTSIITETIFENRFKVVGELRRMGARIDVDGRVAVVRGVPRLSGAMVEVLDDLRGGSALVLAGLAAEGVSVVEGLQHIERGYQELDRKLRDVGARIRRVPAGPALLRQLSWAAGRGGA